MICKVSMRLYLSRIEGPPPKKKADYRFSGN